jgi:hypothetical protein
MQYTASDIVSNHKHVTESFFLFPVPPDCRLAQDSVTDMNSLLFSAGLLRVAHAKSGPGLRVGYGLRSFLHPTVWLLHAYCRHATLHTPLPQLFVVHQVRNGGREQDGAFGNYLPRMFREPATPRLQRSCTGGATSA